jgi:two-component system, sensor histidine kinase and response regulator
MDKKPYDLVFMDVMMPEMNGLEATQEIRKRQNAGTFENYQSRIIIIAMTAQAMQGDREKCIESGMDDYLAKPIRPGDVRNMLAKWTMQNDSSQPNTPPAAAAAPATQQAAVDMERLSEMAGGDKDMLQELVELYYKQTSKQLQQLESAIREGKAEEVRHVAHSCKGASATMGMAPLAAIFFELEKKGRAAVLDGSEALLADATREYKRVQSFLATQPVLAGTPAAALT